MTNLTPNLSISPVNTNQKSILSRLMATEDIVVEHRTHIETAYFDIKNRILVLPKWKNMSNELYDMFVGHEVGHALYTPMYDASGRDLIQIINDIAGPGGNKTMVKSLLNVVEDARIERKMQIKFPGLKRDFVTAYHDLHAIRNFFGIVENEDTSERSFGDRINLHFKIGNQIHVPFDTSETDIVERIATSDTFDDVVEIVKDLYPTCKKEQDAMQPEDGDQNHDMSDDDRDDADNNEQQNKVGQGDENEDGDTDDSSASNDQGEDGQSEGQGDDGQSETSESQDGNGQDQDQSGDDVSGGSGTPEGDLDSETESSGVSTQDNFNESMKDFNDNYTDNHYAELGKYNVNEWIIPIDETYKGLEVKHRENATFATSADTLRKRLTAKVSKGASMLAKQFEMKKAADTHARTSTAKTGVLDTLKVCKYKVSDDVFKRNAVITEGKNHGLVMFVDWSGSMSQELGATLEQLYMMIIFCRKVNIPFDVYAFSSQTPWRRAWSYDNENLEKCPITTEIDEDDEIHIQPTRGMCLYHLATSGAKQRKTIEMLNGIAMLHTCYAGRAMTYTDRYDAEMPDISLPRHLDLGGTPLDDCIVLAADIVNQFRNKHKLQIVHSVFLTDGESHTGCTNYKTHLRTNRKTFDLARRNCGQTKSLLEWFTAQTNAKTIGIFLTKKVSQALRKCRNIQWDDQSKMKKIWNKEKFLNAGKSDGYSELFVIKSDTTIDNGQMDNLAADASFAKIRSAFTKSQTKSATSRTLLNRLAELISA